MKKIMVLMALSCCLLACGQQLPESQPASASATMPPQTMSDRMGGADLSMTEVGEAEPAARQPLEAKKYMALRHHLAVEV